MGEFRTYLDRDALGWVCVDAESFNVFFPDAPDLGDYIWLFGWATGLLRRCKRLESRSFHSTTFARLRRVSISLGSHDAFVTYNRVKSTA